MSALRNRSADEAGLQLSPSTRALAWALARAFAAWLVLFQPLSAIAAVITVDSSGDGGSNDGQCTLTEAITNANDDAQTENDCPAGLGGDRIVLLNNVNLTTDKDPSSEETGLPRITSTIDIQGSGFTVANASVSTFRIFHVESSGDLTLRDLTVTGGLQSAAASGEGGAIFNEGGRVRILDSTLSNNQVLVNEQASGGAIHSEGGELTLVNSRVIDNTIDAPFSQGGGIFSDTDRLTLINTTVSGNTVRSDSTSAFFDNNAQGGGIATQGSGTILLNRVTISGNTVTAAPALSVSKPLAASGGMRIAGDGSTRLINTTISGNQVVSDGADGQASSGGLGISENVTIEHSTIAGNSISQTGGMFARGGGLNVGGGSTVNFSASLLADNSSEHNDSTTSENCYSFAATVLDNGANKADDATCSTIPSDLTAADLNFTLADNGGQVETHSLPSTSSAIGLATSCALRIDAREALRSDPACDSGAFEYGADDRFELSGEAATAPGDPDDQCFGHRFLIGKTENRLHPVDEDWVWFVGAEGATYEIETDDLIGSSDTVLELYELCGTKLDENDDKDVGDLASKITWMVPPGEGGQVLDVRTRQFGEDPGDYAIGEGYDLAITCTASCPPCALPGGDVHEFTFETVMSFREVEACSTIQVLESLVASGGELHLRAGQVVELGDAFSVLDNGTLIVGTDPNLLPPAIVGPTE